MCFRGITRCCLCLLLFSLWGLSCVPVGTSLQSKSSFCAEELERLVDLRRRENELLCVRQHPFLDMPTKLLREACEAGDGTYQWLSQGLRTRIHLCQQNLARCKSLVKEVQNIGDVGRKLGCRLRGWSRDVLFRRGFLVNVCIEQLHDFERKVREYRGDSQRCQVRVPFCKQRIENLRRWRMEQNSAGCRFPHRVFRMDLGELQSRCLGEKRAFFLKNYHEAKRLYQKCIAHHKACRPLQKRWKAGCEESKKLGCGVSHPWCRLVQEWTPCVVWFRRFSRDLESLERLTASCVKNGARCRSLYPKVQSLSKRIASLSCGFHSSLLNQKKSEFVQMCFAHSKEVFSLADELEKKADICAKNMGLCRKLWGLQTPMNKMLEHPKCSDLLFLPLRLGRRSMVSRCVLKPHQETQRWQQMWKRLLVCSGEQTPWPLGEKK